MGARDPQRWSSNLDGVRAWANAHGDPMAPAGATITLRDGRIANVGAFVAYVRSRQRIGRLDTARMRDLESIPGWTWDPLQPGPKGKMDRNEEIRELRRQGVTLAELADRYGMSRQRIHQIAPDAPDPRKHRDHLERRRLERAAERQAERDSIIERARRQR